MTTVVAFDVGGTRLKVGVVVNGAVGEVMSRPTAGLGAGALIALLIDTLADVAAGSVDAVGLAVPGIVDEGRVVALPGKFDGLVGRDLAAEVAASAGAPVFVVNDAIAAGVGEAASGAGAGRRRVVVMTIGTGIGVTVVEDGRPLGAGPWGGGLMGGHVPVMAPDSGAVDSNGARGTIEALCAAPRLLAAAAEAGCDADTVPALLERWGTGDPAARQAVVAYRRNLEQALVALAHAHAPSAIVVGGGPVSTSSDWLLAGMTETVGRRLWSGQDCAIVPAALGDAAALVGVAALAAEV